VRARTPSCAQWWHARATRLLTAARVRRTVCETSKAVGAMMIVAMMLGVAGIAMSTCCLHYPRVLFFPAGLAAFLILVSVTVVAARGPPKTSEKTAFSIEGAFRADSAMRVGACGIRGREPRDGCGAPLMCSGPPSQVFASTVSTTYPKDALLVSEVALVPLPC
jgi:hypothetical protein